MEGYTVQTVTSMYMVSSKSFTGSMVRVGAWCGCVTQTQTPSLHQHDWQPPAVLPARPSVYGVGILSVLRPEQSQGLYKVNSFSGRVRDQQVAL